MSENHIDRFLKINKLTPRKLINVNVNSPELSINNSLKKLSTIVQGKKCNFTYNFFRF